MASRDFCEAPEHDSDHTNPHHRLTMIQSHLVVPTQPARLTQPAKGSLHNPSLGQNLETFCPVGAAHDFQVQFAEWAQLLDPLNQTTQVAAIGPDDLHPA